MSAGVTGTGEGIRLDKWLWAARFFKTRQLAVEAIDGGKVQVNGQRSKPGKTIHPGARVVIRKGSLEWDLVVRVISRQRRPAAEAALLYEESEESRLRRQALLQEQRASGIPAPGATGRPSKRERRMIRHFTRRSDD